MLKAWGIYCKNRGLSFGECLHHAWLSAKAEEVNEQRIEAAKGAADIQSLLIKSQVFFEENFKKSI